MDDLPLIPSPNQAQEWGCMCVFGSAGTRIRKEREIEKKREKENLEKKKGTGNRIWELGK